MKYCFIILLLMYFTFSLMTCSDNSVSSKGTTATFAIQLYDEFPKTSHGNLLTMTDMGGTIFTIEDARVNVRDIQFDLPVDSTDATNQVSLSGPFVMDLEDVETNPEIAEFDIAAGSYPGIEVRFDDAKLEDGLVSPDDELMNNSMVIKGIFEYDGKADREFIFIFKFNENVIFEKQNGLTIRDGRKNNIIIALLVDRWLNNINITECLDTNSILLDNEGNLLIDENNGNGDCNNFKEALKTKIINTYDLNSLL